jgi:hypothetical protein
MIRGKGGPTSNRGSQGGAEVETCFWGKAAPWNCLGKVKMVPTSWGSGDGGEAGTGSLGKSGSS